MGLLRIVVMSCRGDWIPLIHCWKQDPWEINASTHGTWSPMDIAALALHQRQARRGRKGHPTWGKRRPSAWNCRTDGQPMTQCQKPQSDIKYWACELENQENKELIPRVFIIASGKTHLRHLTVTLYPLHGSSLCGGPSHASDFHRPSSSSPVAFAILTTFHSPTKRSGAAGRKNPLARVDAKDASIFWRHYQQNSYRSAFSWQGPLCWGHCIFCNKNPDCAKFSIFKTPPPIVATKPFSDPLGNFVQVNPTQPVPKNLLLAVKGHWKPIQRPHRSLTLGRVNLLERPAKVPHEFGFLQAGVGEELKKRFCIAESKSCQEAKLDLWC